MTGQLVTCIKILMKIPEKVVKLVNFSYALQDPNDEGDLVDHPSVSVTSYMIFQKLEKIY
jgi:hypothetical protein